MPRARDVASGTVLADRLRLAHTHWTRLKGLLGTSSLQEGEALWLKPCRQVHMFGMRYAIDVAFLDDEHRVVRTISRLAPGAVSPRVPEATSVLELPEGTISRTALGEGARIEIDGDATPAPASNVASMLCNAGVAVGYVLFARAHLLAGWRTGRWGVILPMVVLESVLAVLFLLRRQSLQTSARPFDWALAIGGSIVPTLMRTTPALGPLAWIGEPLQAVGLCVALLGALSLGRSIGLVAANRGVQEAGIYRFIRHPIYAGYVLCGLGYIASFPTARNACLLAVSSAAFVVRARVEEQLLSGDARYRRYAQRVPWRFVPWLH